MSQNTDAETVVTAYKHLADKLGYTPEAMHDLIADEMGFGPDTPESLADDAITAAMDAADDNDESDESDAANASDDTDDKGRRKGPVAVGREVAESNGITKNDYFKYRSLMLDAGDFDDDAIQDSWHTLKGDAIAEGDESDADESGDDGSDESDDSDESGDESHNAPNGLDLTVPAEKTSGRHYIAESGPCIAAAKDDPDAEPCGFGAKDSDTHFCGVHNRLESPRIHRRAVEARDAWESGDTETLVAYVEDTAERRNEGGD